jgi:hypothetical protein
MSTPHRCPVCQGRGTVDQSFYSRGQSTSAIGTETCKSCNGTGILWEPSTPRFLDPAPFAFPDDPPYTTKYGTTCNF